MNTSQSAEAQHCPALIISAPSSGSGKTTVTAALARYHRDQGRKVTVFKVGPDFIDPMILQHASGHAVYQLDLWLVGKEGCKDLLYKAASTSDLILIEGVMGLFDGTPSSADLAEFFGIPVLAVIDASAMAQTFAAVCFGLAKHRPSLPFAGVFANRVSSQRHEDILRESLNEDVHFFGRLAKNPDISLPERHLGLVQAQELSDIDTQLDLAAQALAKTELSVLPKAVCFEPVQDQCSDDSLSTESHKALSGKRIIIIKDLAFSFIYAANIDFLTQAGAELVYSSALNDEQLPQGDILYIPGGYPELYAKELSANTRYLNDIRAFAAANKTIVAECGGMLFLLEKLTDLQGQVLPMLGLLPGQAQMQKKLAAIGSQFVNLPLLKNDSEQGDDNNNEMRGHSFHYSKADIELNPIAQSVHHPRLSKGEYVYQHGNIIASYMHWYLPSNPRLALALFT